MKLRYPCPTLGTATGALKRGSITHSAETSTRCRSSRRSLRARRWNTLSCSGALATWLCGPPWPHVLPQALARRHHGVPAAVTVEDASDRAETHGTPTAVM